MIDRCYNQTDLVALYDLVNLTSPDWEYYLALASILSGPTGSVLDAGCGTGALTIEVIYMAGHAIQCLLRDADIRLVFRAVVDILAPGRQFVFEIRNPACVLW
tara:strand:- start:69 stop:377 length:309 start_codon:yes stop_codon:yes gene_type:complete